MIKEFLFICRPDGWRWHCTNKIRKYAKPKGVKCGQTQEFRKGTFFEHSHMSIFQILGFAHLWMQKFPLNVIRRELKLISNSTLVDWASFCREVVFSHLFDNPEKLGGVGKIVEINKSKFGKRKYHRGHRIEGQCVFGGYERGTGRVFMVPVEFRYVLFVHGICVRVFVELVVGDLRNIWCSVSAAGGKFIGWEHLYLWLLQ